MKRLFFGLNLDGNKSNFVLDEKKDNKLLMVIRKVVKMLKIDEKNAYSKIINNNIRTLAAEIEMKLDFFLEEQKIPFRTEDFLLILFQELYEEFICSLQNLY